jgi:hypothetical protein
VADLNNVVAAIGVGVTAVLGTAVAMWPVIKRVWAVVPETPHPQPSAPALPTYLPDLALDLERRLREIEARIAESANARAERDRRIDGLEERERQNNALLHELIGKLKANGR